MVALSTWLWRSELVDFVLLIVRKSSPAFLMRRAISAKSSVVTVFVVFWEIKDVVLWSEMVVLATRSFFSRCRTSVQWLAHFLVSSRMVWRVRSSCSVRGTQVLFIFYLCCISLPSCSSLFSYSSSIVSSSLSAVASSNSSARDTGCKTLHLEVLFDLDCWRWWRLNLNNWPLKTRSVQFRPGRLRWAWSYLGRKGGF